MKTKLSITVFAIALFMTGCSKDFLDKNPSEFISAEDIESSTELNPEVGIGNIRGLYATMMAAGSGGTNLDHDDFGQKGYDIYSDMLSGDMILAALNYGWYGGITKYLWTQNFANNANYKPWRFYYRLIRGANSIIDDYGGADADLEDPDDKAIMGQAKAIRGYAYFYLVNFYGEGDYDEISGQGVIPLLTSLDQTAQPLSTGAEIYEQITTDLEDAIEDLEGFNRTDVNQVDADVAKGLLAYAYAAMGGSDNYAKVKSLTQEVMGSSYSLMDADQLVGGLDGDYDEGGFNDVNKYKDSWMWGQDITLDNGLDLVSWWGQVDLFTYSYASVGDPKTINYDLYQSIPDNDIRKQQFDQYSDDQYVPTGKFYAPARVSQGQRDVTTDYIYMRVAEMYLLNAEAAAQTGDYPTAREDLKELLEIRMPGDGDDYVDAVADGDLLDEIYQQTRIELWGEGKSYLAFKRLKKSIVLPENHLTLEGETVSYDDPKVSFKIPEEEVLNNPNL